MKRHYSSDSVHQTESLYINISACLNCLRVSLHCTTLVFIRSHILEETDGPFYKLQELTMFFQEFTRLKMSLITTAMISWM